MGRWGRGHVSFVKITRENVISIPQASDRHGFPIDIVPALVANGPHPAIKDYLKRPRGKWPPQEQLCEVQQMPMCSVLVGSKESECPGQQARDSWSAGEVILVSKLPKSIKQGLIAAKFTFKHCVKMYHDSSVIADGRSRVGSYHLKTTLLNYLESTPPSETDSAFDVMMCVFHDLSTYLKRGNLPHYFFPECNLLATVGRNERQIALQAIQDIVCDPAAALLQCPSNPTDIYGDVSPDDLVAAFRRVLGHQCCARSWEDLIQLLNWVDQWRVQRYRIRQERDKGLNVSGRPELTRLVDMLEKIKHE